VLWFKSKAVRVLSVVALCVLFLGCSTEPNATGVDGVRVPLGFAPQKYPADNIPNADRIELGRRLFFSKELSRTGEVSCASCHQPSLYFADDKATTPGVEGRPGTRNVPSLINIGYQPYLLREGGVPTLEMQVLVPIQEHNEFDDNILRVVARLLRDPELNSLSNKAYGRDIDSYVLTRAIACFERSLVSSTSRYDEYNVRGRTSALTADEHEGRKIFFGNQANCGSCHSGVHLTNYGFENNGLYNPYPDSGRFRLTDNPADIGRFKVPSLRNVSHTAPYMFDGSLSTLREVVMHYNSGGKLHVNQNPSVRPLNLTERQQQNLVAFLMTL
jgi:cytochrome c peroxidase